MLSTSLVAVTLAGAVAFVQRDAATAEARDARARQLAVESLAAIEEDPELAVLIALEAIDISLRASEDPLPQAIGALQQSVQQTRLVRRISGGGSSGFISYPKLTASPTAGWIAAIDADGYVNITDRAGGLAQQLPPPSLELATLALAGSADGGQVAVAYGVDRGGALVAASPDHPDVVVFEVATGDELGRLFVNDRVHSVDFSPDGRLLAVGSDESVSIHDWRAETEVVRVGSDIASDAIIGDAVFVNDGTVVAFPIFNVGLALYSTAADERLGLVEVEGTQPWIAADPQGVRLAFVAGGRLQVYEAQTHTVRQLGPADPLTLAWSPDGTNIAHAGFDSAIQVVDVDSGETTMTLAGSRDNVLGLDYLDDTTVVNSADNEILVWDVSPQGRPELRTVRPTTGPQWGYQISADASRIALFSFVGESFELLDSENGNTLAALRDEAVDNLFGVRAVSPDFTLVASHETSGRSTVRSLPSLDVVAEYEPCRSPLVFTPDSRLVLVSGDVCLDPRGDDHAHSQVVDIATGEVVFELPYRWIYSARFNPDGEHPGGRYLVVTDQEVIDFYDIATGELLGRLNEELPGALLNMTFDPHGRYVVGGTTEGTVWALDLNHLVAGSTAEDALVFRQRTHTGAAPWPAVTSDGRIATAGFDGNIRLWDMHTGEMLVEFRSAVDIPVVAFSPDGSTLFYPDAGNIARFSMDHEELVSQARSLLTRDFSPDECARYRGTEQCA